MTQPPKSPPPTDPTKQDRLAEALRDNLKKRKAQTRGRQTPASPKPPRQD